VHKGSGCPSERDLQALARGELDTPAMAVVRAHLDECIGCQEMLAEIRRSLGIESFGLDEPITHDAEQLAKTTDPATQTEVRRQGIEDALELPMLGRSSDPRAIGRIAAYEINAVLGRGGMGIVLDAFDTVLHRRVAIKVLSPQLASSQTAHRRFLREARAAAGINHANVVTIHAVAEEAGMPYLVMEYVAGRTLRERIRLGPLDLATMLRIGSQIAAGLAAAHQHGVIHRDIKPANVLLEDGIERVKISDFGLALVTLDHTQVSSADRPVGTPAYMSPEQVGGRRVDARSDLFSLGCVLYAMITGKSPFQGNNSVFIARMVAEFDPPALHEIKRDTPRFLSDIVGRLLCKDPNRRFQSADEVRDLLLAHLAEVNQAPSDSLCRAVHAPRPRAIRRRWLVVGGAGLVLLVALVAAGVYLRPPSESPVVPPPERPGPSAKPLFTVAQAGDADHRSIAAALRAAGPGATIRILDAAVYKEALRIAEATRLRGLTIEAKQGASLESSAAEPVVTVENTPGVVVRGLRIRTGEQQHAISVRGACPGLTLDGLILVQPPEATSGTVALWPGTRGTAEQPVVFRGLDVSCGDIGIVLVGAADQPVSWVRVEDCRIAGPGVHVAMEKCFADVAVVGNLFVRGRAGVSLGVAKAGTAQRLYVAHNTFFGTHAWLALEHCALDQPDLRIANNLILESQEIRLTGQDLTPVAPHWFHNNWWEKSDGFNGNQAHQVSTVKNEVKLLSRDPASNDFLRPAPGQFPTAEAQGAAGRPYVGALNPPMTHTN
jgi:tRNA A-37 threonylcarbamoyl transferase component Bud32